MSVAAAIVAAHQHPVQERSLEHLTPLYTTELHGRPYPSEAPSLDHHVHHQQERSRRIAIIEERRLSVASGDSAQSVAFGRRVESWHNGDCGSDADSLPDTEPGSPTRQMSAATTSMPSHKLSSISSQDWDMIMASSGLVDLKEQTKKKLWIDGDRFQFCIGALITLNVIVIGLETDLNDRTVDFQAMTPWKMVECTFCLVWVGEALLRMYFERWHYFVSGWNILDIILVVSSLLELLILPYIVGKEFLPAFFRAVRILRLLRLLRLVRLVPFFKELWLIICGYVEALKTLGWVLLLLAIIIYSGAIYMTILVGQQCSEKYEFWSDCEDIWGSVPGSMYSLFQVLTLESWSMLIARPVLKKKPHLAAFFLGFLMLTTFGLLNIIVGVIVENTLKASNNELRRTMAERDAKMRMELMGLKQLFEEADEDRNGNVDVYEFKSIFEKPEVKERLNRLDIPCDNPEALFEMLDEDGGGSITIFEFIEGASRLKSPPKPTEMRSAAHQVHNTEQTISKMTTTIGQMAKALGMHDDAATATNKRTRRPGSPSRRRNRRLQTTSSAGSAESMDTINSLPFNRGISEHTDTYISERTDHYTSEHTDGSGSGMLSSAFSLEKDSPNLERRLLGVDGSNRPRGVPHPKVHDPASLHGLLPQTTVVQDHPKRSAAHSANRERLEGIEWSVGQRLQRLERIAHNLVRSQDKVRDAVNEVLTRLPQPVPNSTSVSGTGA
mmetsp:Transcript_128956/g.248458  ORF Transcript_128956/g.248458 Transcript_128956/m.248458 type:complete len:726 (-) Transcript_128956:26-2203(-)